MKSKFSKNKLWDYFILTARFLLAWTFLRYGLSKLMDAQFGLNKVELATQIKDLSLFKISWYLFGQEPFNTFIGISQIICGLLLLFNRTCLMGAFVFLPIVTNILLIDLSFMPPALAYGFAWRLGFYILLDLLIIWHYKDRLKTIWKSIWYNVNTKYNFPIWAYLLLPLFAIGLEMMGAVPKVLTLLILHPAETIGSIMDIPQILGEILKKVGI